MNREPPPVCPTSGGDYIRWLWRRQRVRLLRLRARPNLRFALRIPERTQVRGNPAGDCRSLTCILEATRGVGEYACTGNRHGTSTRQAFSANSRTDQRAGPGLAGNGQRDHRSSRRFVRGARKGVSAGLADGLRVQRSDLRPGDWRHGVNATELARILQDR